MEREEGRGGGRKGGRREGKREGGRRGENRTAYIAGETKGERMRTYRDGQSFVCGGRRGRVEQTERGEGRKGGREEEGEGILTVIDQTMYDKFYAVF